MSRKELPTTFLGQKLLFDDIKKKVDADGADGELVAFLAEHNINLADDKLLVDAAHLKYKSFLSFSKQSEKLCEKRDKLLNPVIKKVTKSVQYLKGFYNPDYKMLGDWDVTVTDGGKVTIPTDPEKFLTFIIAFKLKNDDYDEPLISPLAQFLTDKKISLADCVTDATAALALHEEFKTATSNSEAAHQAMVTKSAHPFYNLLSITNFLMKLHVDNEKELGDYGLKVVSTPKVEKVKDIKLAIGESKLSRQAKVGSIVANTGTETVYIHKGKTITTTNPLELQAGKSIALPSGYSIISYQNTSTTTFVKIQVIPRDKSKI